MVREPYLTIDTKKGKHDNSLPHYHVRFITKNSKGILLRALMCFALSYFLCAQFITQSTVCSAKIYKVKEHEKPAGLRVNLLLTMTSRRRKLHITIRMRFLRKSSKKNEL